MSGEAVFDFSPYANPAQRRTAYRLAARDHAGNVSWLIADNGVAIVTTRRGMRVFATYRVDRAGLVLA